MLRCIKEPFINLYYSPPSPTHRMPDELITDCVHNAAHKFLVFSANLLWIFAWVSRNSSVMRIYSGEFNRFIHREHYCKTYRTSWCTKMMLETGAEEQKFQCQNVMGFLNRRWLTVVSQKNCTSRMMNRAENLLQECVMLVCLRIFLVKKWDFC